MLRSRRLRGFGDARLAPALRARGLAVIALVLAPPRAAQTLVPNPNLDTQLSPWMPFVSAAPDPVGSGIAPAWVPRPDVDGSAASGSARIDFTVTSATANAASGMAQCFDFDRATQVDFVYYGMHFNVPATTAADGSLSATVELRLYADPGCSGFISGGTQGQVLAADMPSDGAWYGLADHRFVPAGAPVVAASAEIRGYLRQTGAAPVKSDYPIHLDRFVVVLNSTTPVELMQFGVE
jgi:hypothetical protein